ncbi:MAG: LPS assembly lipoprotein LptE [Candidatus Omnitrophota bacterium]
MKKRLSFPRVIGLPIVLLIVILAGLPGCGYRMAGFTSQIPQHIKTVVIPSFENKTARYQADQYLTYAVKEEFIKRSNLTLVDRDDQADALLEGTITGFDVKPVSYANDASANLYRITIQVSVRFIDLKNNTVLFEGDGITFTDNYEIEDTDFFTRETETLLNISEEFASSVVTTILENF